MKSFAALALSLFTVVASQSALANFDHSQFTRIKDAKDVVCKAFDTPRTNDTVFTIDYKGSQIFYKNITGQAEAHQLLNICRSAVLQASEAGNMIYMNPESGLVMPDNGFFTQNAQ